jgi:hypothetical protein
MGIMRNAMNWFRKAVSEARDASDRETLLCELDDIKIVRQDLTCREIEIMRELRSMGHAPAVVEPCHASEAMRTFSARYPDLAADLRQPAYSAPVLQFRRNEVRSVKP